MASRSIKSLLVAGFSILALCFSQGVLAQQSEAEGVSKPAESKEEALDPGKLLMEHILDAHEFHFISYKSADGQEHEIAIPLPVIVYTKEKGFSVFMSSRFEHGHTTYNGFGLFEGKIKAVDDAGKELEDVKVYDLSMTRNVVQMILALAVLVWIMTSVASKYKKNGANSAPTGMQNAMEPVITFIRDEVGKSNLGHKYEKYMPYLLTVFFFILINNLFGLIPGSANVTGNIAFTAVLGVISFVVIMFSTNGHFWGHIFNPPVPGFVKPILVVVEFLSIFTKPFALIIRLFANMVAGHMIITCLIMLIFIFGGMAAAAGYGFSPLSLAFTIFIYMIEVLVAFIQAFIFTNLTAVFIGQAFEGEHHDEHAHATH
ncbi:MAG: F0F1 ATP synthase subunit A [Bacteroidota bacterium]|nr:F0F1 ATP synthase subunit A [Bacteroidota bacterium]